MILTQKTFNNIAESLFLLYPNINFVSYDNVIGYESPNICLHINKPEAETTLKDDKCYHKIKNLDNLSLSEVKNKTFMLSLYYSLYKTHSISNPIIERQYATDNCNDDINLLKLRFLPLFRLLYITKAEFYNHENALLIKLKAYPRRDATNRVVLYYGKGSGFVQFDNISALTISELEEIGALWN